MTDSNKILRQICRKCVYGQLYIELQKISSVDTKKVFDKKITVIYGKSTQRNLN